MSDGHSQGYQISPMKRDDVPLAMRVWRAQFERHCKGDSFPDFWDGGQETVANYLLRQIEKGNAVAARKENHVAGYLAWMDFDFHGERSAFLPIVGNAAVAENESAILYDMYLAASKRWVREDRFNHLWMIFDDDAGLRDRLYNLGFGSYVIDACRKTEPETVSSSSAYKITEATQDDVDEVLALENESEDNLLRPPVFLVRERWKRDDVMNLLHEDKVFVAWDKGRAIGMMSVNLNQKHHFEHLTHPDSAGSLCAYVRPEYRGRGVGAQILRKVCETCRNNGKPFLHVSFESANPDAIRFWPKHFKPAIRSVRRGVNRDANR